MVILMMAILYKETIEKAEAITEVKAEAIFADRGYKGKENHPTNVKVFLSGSKRVQGIFKKLLKGRSGIEPIIGHIKNDHRMAKNYLLGKLGDKINAVLAGCGFNLRKILRFITIENEPLYAIV